MVRPFDAAGLAQFASASLAARQAPESFQLASGMWVSTLPAGFPRLVDSPAIPDRRPMGVRADAPAAVDLRLVGLDGPVKHQQQAGVCWSFAMSTVIENSLRRARRGEVIAPLHVISMDAWNQVWQGGSTRPIAHEPSWPYDPIKACKLKREPDVWCVKAYNVESNTWQSDPALVNEASRADAAGVVRAVKFEKVRGPLRFEQFAELLANGQSAYLSIGIDSDAWTARGGVIPEYPVATRGGHAVVVAGYRTGTSRGRELLLHNSWGSNWGEGGYAWISEATLHQHGDYGFTLEAEGGGGAVPVGPPPPTGVGFPLPLPFPLPFPSTPTGTATGTAPTTPPTGTAPTTPPGAPGCPAGQGLDVLRGQCAPLCRNGLPPAAGVCLP